MYVFRILKNTHLHKGNYIIAPDRYFNTVYFVTVKFFFCNVYFFLQSKFNIQTSKHLLNTRVKISWTFITGNQLNTLNI